MLKALVVTFILSCFFSTVLISADYYDLGAAGSGTELIVINEHGACHGVGNSSANVYFVPTKTAGEWANFRANPPAGVTILSCCAKVC